MYRATAPIVCLLLIFGCNTTPSRDAALTIDDSGKTVALAVGEALVIRLEANPTTGYQWAVLDDAAGVLKQVGDAQYQPREVDQAIVGAGGAQTWRFEAVAPGEATLTLGYQRPWEKDAVPAQTFALRVTVTASR